MAAAVLHVVDGPGAGRSFPIDDEIVVGRGREADIVLTDLEVSRRHMSVRAEGETVVVTDLGSSNGTHISGHRIGEAVRVREGEEIRIGATLLEYRRETIAGEDATPTQATSVHRGGV